MLNKLRGILRQIAIGKDKIIEISASLEPEKKSCNITELFESIVKKVYENRESLKRCIVDCDVN